MILTVTLNPAIDRTLVLDQLKPGTVNRVRQVQEVMGGKGINVARVLQALGTPAIAAGFVGLDTVDLVKHLLVQEAFETCLFEVAGSTRINTKVFATDNRSTTDLNEPGFHVSQDDLANLAKELRLLASHCDYAVFSGSCPPGLPDDVYTQLIRALSLTIPCALDTDAQWLRPALSACPSLIKPNLEELENTIGQKLSTEREIVQACRHLASEQTIQLILVSLGAEGSLLVAGHDSYRAPALKVTVNGTVGAGDAMLAGFLDAMIRQLSPQEAMAWATACGALAVSSSDRTAINRADASRMARQAFDQVRRL